MEGLLQFGLTNAAWATVLALAAAAGTRWLKRYPALVHALWLTGTAEAGDAILGPASVILGQRTVPRGRTTSRAKREQGSDGVSRTESALRDFGRPSLLASQARTWLGQCLALPESPRVTSRRSETRIRSSPPCDRGPGGRLR